MKTKIGMLLIAMCMSAIAFAQKPVEKTRVKKNFTPEQIAQKRTDIMKIRLQLNGKDLYLESATDKRTNSTKGKRENRTPKTYGTTKSTRSRVYFDPYPFSKSCL